MRLQDKVCIITGAGSGMGRVASALFAREGARVVVAEVNAGAGEETVAQVRSEGGDARLVRTDVTQEDECRALVETTLRDYGRVDVLYNNAGHLPGAGPLGGRYAGGGLGARSECQRARRVPVQ
jgi:NAD(P)-dependent dehydrogenase (short-subunit alcohol dehydrogenase family)